jgi:hypothetical protein
MLFQRPVKATIQVFAMGAVITSALVLTGCDEYVHITRDRDVRIARHATWAWKPAAEETSHRDSRRVTSRDDIRRGETVTRSTDDDSDVLRGKVKSAIERNLGEKGLKEADDPQDADFLVDFHIAVRGRNMAVERVYPGVYPGLMCGPFGCYGGWGPAAVGYENIRFREGTIVLDVLQGGSNHLVYRAVGEKPVERNAFSLSQDQVNGLVHHLLKDLNTSRK